MKYLLPIGLLLLACGGQQQKPVVKEEPEVKKTPYMHITVKDFGDIVIKMYGDEVPNNVKSVMTLADSGFYNGLKFHRIIKGFVIQGGCPQGDGTGGPGYELEDEILANLKHLKGTVAMANHGANTNGSQFYICLAPQPGLDGRFTIIGEVVEGMDVVDKIGSVKTSGPPSDRPLKDVVMEKVWIEQVPVE
jgi:cyclophilin family peptidyl-prolyl cis-trans isomerase